MSDQQHDDNAVEDLDVPMSDAENVMGGIGRSIDPSPGIKIDRTNLKVTRESGYGW